MLQLFVEFGHALSQIGVFLVHPLLGLFKSLLIYLGLFAWFAAFLGRFLLILKLYDPVLIVVQSLF